jgi:hypothetical protein
MNPQQGGIHMGPCGQFPDGTARVAYEDRLLSKIEAAWPDREVHYLFGGYVVTPRGTSLACAATLETLWEKLMTCEAPQATVLGTVVRDEPAALRNRSTEEASASVAEAWALAPAERSSR